MLFLGPLIETPLFSDSSLSLSPPPQYTLNFSAVNYYRQLVTVSIKVEYV
jgi:hypothetical protein